MRNLAFSIVLVALALMEIAVVTAALPRSGAQTVAAGNSESGARQVLASAETGRGVSKL